MGYGRIAVVLLRLFPMKHFRFVTTALLISATLALGGCGLFGCGGFATNGGGFGGCSVGTRF
jgi:hypothetical protein